MGLNDFKLTGWCYNRPVLYIALLHPRSVARFTAMYYKLTFLLLLVINTAFAQSDENWVLKHNNDGVKIYTSKVPNSKINAIKVDCHFDVPVSRLVAVLMDVKNSEDWLYHTSSNYIIKQVSPSELYYYSMVEVPWPVSNRDFIAHIKVSQDAVTKVITVDAPCIPDMVPRKPGVVRVADSKGKWVLTPVGKNKVHVLYTLHADPGGSIPAWLSNMFATKGPTESFQKLKLQLQKPAYKNVKLAYIIE